MIDKVKKVLVIDDDEDTLELLRMTLENHHFRCFTATAPTEGIEKAILNKPDLILLDLMLPEMSGFGFLREIKSRPELASTPIVVLTALADEDIASESISLGARGYLTKACNAKELVHMVKEYAS